MQPTGIHYQVITKKFKIKHLNAFVESNMKLTSNHSWTTKRSINHYVIR